MQGLYLDNPRVVDALAGGAAGRPTYALARTALIWFVAASSCTSVLGNLQAAPQLCLLVLSRF